MKKMANRSSKYILCTTLALSIAYIAWRIANYVSASTMLVVMLCLFMSLGLWTAYRARKSKIFDSRAEMDMNEVYNKFFSNSGLPRELVSHYWNFAAKSVGVPPGKLLPTDRFKEELGGFWSVDDDTNEMYEKLYQDCSEAGVKFEEAKIVTLEDFIRTSIEVKNIGSHPKT